MFVASKHKVVAVKIKLKSTGRMVFVWRKWDNSVHTQPYLQMQSYKLYRQVSFPDAK